MKLSKIMPIILLILVSTMSFADKSRPVTLNECISIAVQNNQSIKVTLEDKRKALAEYRGARAQKSFLINGEIKTVQYLQADASAISSALNVAGTHTTIGLFVGIGASYSLFDPKKSTLIKSARESIKLSKYQSRKVINEIIYSVKESYYTYILSNDTVKLKEKLFKSNEEKLKIARILFKNGQKPAFDVSKARVNVIESKTALEQAQNSNEMTKMKLLSLMGIYKTEINITPERKNELPVLKYSLDALFKLGESNFPDLQILRIQKRISKINIDLEKARRYPDVKISLGLGYQNLGFSMSNFAENFSSKNWNPVFNGGIVASFPIFNGGLIKARTDSAKSDYKKILYKEKEVLMNMRTLIKTNVITLKQLVKNIEMTKIMKENSEKHLSITKKMYERGSGTQLELNDAYTSLINAELSLLKAKNEYMLTIAKLSKIVGLGEDSLCKN